MSRKHRFIRRHLVTISAIIGGLAILMLTLILIIQAGGPAYASGPTLAATYYCDSTPSCSVSISATSSEVVLAFISNQALYASCPTVTTSGFSLQVSSGLGYDDSCTSLYVESGASVSNVAGTGITSEPTAIVVEVWSGITLSEIDTSNALASSSSTSVNAVTENVYWDYYSELTITWGIVNTNTAGSTGCSQTYLSTVGSDPITALCYGYTPASGSPPTGVSFTGQTSTPYYSAGYITFDVTSSGSLATSNTTATTTTTTSTTTTTLPVGCTIINGNEYCSSTPTTVINGEPCAWSGSQDEYVCQTTTTTTTPPSSPTTVCLTINGVVTCTTQTTVISGQTCAYISLYQEYVCPTTTTTTPAPTTSTTACQTLYQNNTPIELCSSVPPTTIDGDNCAWNVGINGWTCQTVTQTYSGNGTTCAWYDIVCGFTLLFEPSSSAIASLNTAVGTSGLDAIQSGLSSIGTSIYNFVTDSFTEYTETSPFGVSGSGDYANGSATFTPNPGVYTNGGECGYPDSDNGPPALLVDGHLDLNNINGVADEAVTPDPGGLCYWLGQEDAVISNVPDWYYIKGITEVGIVIMTIIGAIRIIINAFQSGK